MVCSTIILDPEGSKHWRGAERFNLTNSSVTRYYRGVLGNISSVRMRNTK